MTHKFALAVAMIAALAVAFFSGASVSPGRARPVDERKPDAEKPAITVGQRTAVFNMAAVMRDFRQAKYQVYLLNEKKKEISKKLIAMRAEYIEITQELHPKRRDKDEKEKRLLALVRAIEDEDRDINKQLNEDASAIISDLYDKIYAAVERTAKLNGYQIVLTYPDAVTPEEQQNPHIKELKLKPPAAQPFYVDPQIDITGAIVRTLNA